MKKENDYQKDLAEIRSLMERSTKFLSLSGWAGIFAGIYALVAAFLSVKLFSFYPDTVFYKIMDPSRFFSIILLGVITIVTALLTAFYFSYKNAVRKKQSAWNNSSKQLLTNMSAPLLAGGLLIIALAYHNVFGIIPSLTLIFYGLSLFQGGANTYKEVRIFGIVQIVLGIFSVFFIQFTMIIWAAGFGAGHVIYGIYMFRYEK